MKYKLISNALKCFLDEEYAEPLAKILEKAEEKDFLTFEEIVSILKNYKDIQEILIFGYEWKLIIPQRSIKTIQWNDRILLLKDGELFTFCKIVRAFVIEAARSGIWNLDKAVEITFKNKPVEKIKSYQKLIHAFIKRSVGGRVTASQIKQECIVIGIDLKEVDSIISSFKAVGIFSPDLGYFPRFLKEVGPIYELNPSLRVCKPVNSF